MTKFNLEIFLNALNDQLNILIDSNISSPHELYDKFVSKFENVVDEFAPMRKASLRKISLDFFYFYLYIYPPDLQKSDGSAIHRVSNYTDLLPEMPRYCCPLVI